MGQIGSFIRNFHLSSSPFMWSHCIACCSAQYDTIANLIPYNSGEMKFIGYFTPLTNEHAIPLFSLFAVKNNTLIGWS